MILTNVFIWAVKKKVPIIKSQKGKIQNMGQHGCKDSSVRMAELSSLKSVSGTDIHRCSSGSLCWGLLPLSVCLFVYLFVLSRNSTGRPGCAPVFQGSKDHSLLERTAGLEPGPSRVPSTGSLPSVPHHTTLSPPSEELSLMQFSHPSPVC